MGSDLPKVLHPLLGEPLVVHAIRAARAAGVAAIVLVVGHGAAAVRAALAPEHPDLRYALQAEQRGTGHAVLCALPELADHDGPVLILSGDVPGLRAATLRALVERCAAAGRAGARDVRPRGSPRLRPHRPRRGRPRCVRSSRSATPTRRRGRSASATRGSTARRPGCCAANCRARHGQRAGRDLPDRPGRPRRVGGGRGARGAGRRGRRRQHAGAAGGDRPRTCPGGQALRSVPAVR
jgi:CTP:molybdopterin cytidylyltransferase MocA